MIFPNSVRVVSPCHARIYGDDPDLDEERWNWPFHTFCSRHPAGHKNKRPVPGARFQIVDLNIADLEILHPSPTAAFPSRYRQNRSQQGKESK